MTNCPNCGAVIDHDRYIKCPYCNTEYFDFSPLKIDEEFWIKLKNMNNKTVLAKAVLTGAKMEQRQYADVDMILELKLIPAHDRLFAIVKDGDNE